VFCELPKTATGKVQKYELREQARQLAPAAQPDAEPAGMPD
jgi:acyl-coenzyme A synthetase/AMP-(fatty) acid ligase